MTHVCIVGGAGFIGVNTALFHLKKGDIVTIVDNLSRHGTVWNLQLLEKTAKVGLLKFVHADIRKMSKALDDALANHERIYHFAAQVAVTTSLKDPIHDFEVNALGTFNLLETVRRVNPTATFIYSSTNKVYGSLEGRKVVSEEKRVRFADDIKGVNEHEPLDFHSPYGCSKGTGDQYTIDYARIYGMNTIVFRQSCVYGINQFGVEDQGWVAHFLIASFLKKPLTIFGDGKQVRDLLFVDDLIEAYDLAANNIEKTRGQAYNMGGGHENTLSLLELLEVIPKIMGPLPSIKYDKTRPGDQPIFVSDNSKALKDFGWKPKTSVPDGLKRLADWIKQNPMFRNGTQTGSNKIQCL